jgi:hypothetical protein
VLALAGGEEIDLPPARRKRPCGRSFAAHPEQDQLGDVAEVEADAAATSAEDRMERQPRQAKPTQRLLGEIHGKVPA